MAMAALSGWLELVEPAGSLTPYALTSILC